MCKGFSAMVKGYGYLHIFLGQRDVGTSYINKKFLIVQILLWSLGMKYK